MGKTPGTLPKGKEPSIKSLLQDAVWYGGANIITKVLSLCSFPLIARHFSANNFGVVELFATIAPLIAFIISFGQDSAVAWFFIKESCAKERQRMISESFWYQVSLSVPVTAALWFFAPKMLGVFAITGGAVSIFQIVILQVPFCLIYNYALVILKWSSARTLYASLFVSSAGLYALMIILGTLYLSINIETFFWLNFINQAVFGLLGLFFIRNWIIIPAGMNYLPRLLVHGAPIGLATMLASMLPVGEKWIIAHLLSVEQVGHYAAGGRIAIVIAFMAEAFQSAWAPFAHRYYRDKDARLIFARTMIVFSSVVLSLVFALAALATPLIILLASEKYIEGAAVVFPVAFGLALLCIAQVMEVSLGIGMKPRLVMYGALFRMITTIGLIFILAPKYGLQGVAASALFGCVTQSGAVALFVRHTQSESWNVKEAAPIILAAFVGGFCLVVTQYNWGIKAGSNLAWGGVAMIVTFGWIAYRRVGIGRPSC